MVCTGIVKVYPYEKYSDLQYPQKILDTHISKGYNFIKLQLNGVFFMILKNATVLNDSFQFEKTDLVIENGKFAAIGKTDKDGIDLNGKYIVPGLIEIHTHGAVGYDFCVGNPECVEKVAEFMLKNGVTAYAPGIYSAEFDIMLNGCRYVKAYAEDGEKYAKIAGVQLEGPYLSPNNHGGMRPCDLRRPDVDEFNMMNDLTGGRIKLIAIAPEIDGAFEFIEKMHDKVRISIAHTTADYETAKKAIEKGALHLTHTFNAMPSYHHRNPGVLGAAFESDITCECISDGIHLHPVTVHTLYKIVGDDRLILISDSMAATGLPEGIHTITGGREVTVKDGKVTLPDGTIAGGTATLLHCVRQAIRFGIPTKSAFKCATINPAKAMGVDAEMGSIAIGKCADFLILDSELNLCNVYKDGKLCY